MWLQGRQRGVTGEHRGHEHNSIVKVGERWGRGVGGGGGGKVYLRI